MLYFLISLLGLAVAVRDLPSHASLSSLASHLLAIYPLGFCHCRRPVGPGQLENKGELGRESTSLFRDELWVPIQVFSFWLS